MGMAFSLGQRKAAIQRGGNEPGPEAARAALASLCGQQRAPPAVRGSHPKRLFADMARLRTVQESRTHFCSSGVQTGTAARVGPGQRCFSRARCARRRVSSRRGMGSVQWPKLRYVQRSGLTQMDKAPPDAQWLSAMDAVYTAPKYDSHLDNEFDLIRDVTQKYGVRDPDITLYLLASS